MIASLAVLAITVAAPAAAAAFHVDPAASEVVFHLQTTWHGVEGRTKKISGTLTTESGDLLKDGRISVEIDAASLDTGNSRRDRTMRDSHLETARHPTITFASTGAAVKGGGDSLKVPGDLTIHGVKRAVELTVTLRPEGQAWLVTGELPVKLSEFAIPDPSIFLNRVQDDVRVTFTVKLVPAAPLR